jgi:hypothetical protein
VLEHVRGPVHKLSVLHVRHEALAVEADLRRPIREGVEGQRWDTEPGNNRDKSVLRR